MALKGNFDTGTSYSKGDIVVFDNGEKVVYVKNDKACPAGTPPVDSRYWNRVLGYVADCVLLIMDALAMASETAQSVAESAAQNAIGEYFFDEKTLILGSSTASSDKRYAITVEDGDSGGEMSIDEIEEEGDDT